LKFMGWLGGIGRNSRFSAQERQASSLFSKYMQDKDLGTLQEAVRLYRAALAADRGNPAYAHNLGVALSELSRYDKDPALVRQAVDAGRVAVSGTPDGNRNKAMYLSTLAGALIALSKQADNAERADSVAEAIAMYRESLARVPEGDPRRAELHLRIGLAVKSLSELNGDTGQLTVAISALQAAVDATPENDPKRGSRLSILANALRIQFHATGDRALLDSAISTFQAAHAALKPDDTMRASALSLLAICLRHRFGQTRDLDDLRAEVQTRRLAVKVAPVSSERLYSLAVALRDLFSHTADTALLEEAVLVSEAAVNAAASSGLDQAAYLDQQAQNLKTLAHRTGNLDHFRKAAAVSRDAVARAAADDRRLPGYRSNLASSLRALYTETGDQAALTESVATARHGVADTPPGDSALGARLSILGNSLLDEFLCSGREELLAEAISAVRSALAATPPGHANEAGFLHSLGTALEADYERTGRAEVLAEAIQVDRDSVAVTAETDHNRPDRLNSLGTALYKLYRRTGDMDTLAEATELIRAAVSGKSDGSPSQLGFMINLGNCLHALFKRTGDQAAIIEAHGVFRKVADGLPVGHPLRASAHNGLGFALLARYERNAGEGYLSAAVKAFRMAITLAPQGGPAQDGYMSNLAIALRKVHEKTGDEDALREAIELHRTVLAHARPGSPSHALRANNLAIALRSLYVKTGNPEILAEVVEKSRLAAATTPADHSDHASRLHSLGISLVDLFRQTGEAAVLAEARTVLARAAQSTAAPVHVRVRAGRLRSTADTLAGDFPSALTAIEDVVGLLPLLAPPGLHRIDRQHRIGEEALGVAAQAAAAALNAGQPARAVELIEQARGLLIAEALAAADDGLSGLGELAPSLARELTGLMGEIAALDDRAAVGEPKMPSLVPFSSAGEEAEARRLASVRWDALLARIRALPGLAGFWEPPSADSLRPAAADGPVVVVTASSDRCDALILDGTGENVVRVVPLPELTDQETLRRANGFRAALANVYSATAEPADASQAQLDMRQTLEWLWDTVAEPVLQALGHVSAPGPGQSWPRVFWCPSGALGALPLHAAGYHDSGDGRAVLDRVVSSYTPTVRALAHLRARNLRHTDSRRASVDTLIVAVPDAPGASPLPGVEAEVDSLRSVLPDASILAGPAATRAAVLAALAHYRLVHFACHGMTNLVFPDSSQLILYDHATCPLTVAQIRRHHLPDAGLAYLSACRTSGHTPQLVDESVHITSAFLLAGYSQVVGTMWAVSDYAASRVAAQFYGYLTAAGSHPPDIGLASHALHLAVRSLRAKHPARTSLWASHIHVGV
jgi:tetratricopeptide (TPR) repeat protein